MYDCLSVRFGGNVTFSALIKIEVWFLRTSLLMDVVLLVLTYEDFVRFRDFSSWKKFRDYHSSLLFPLFFKANLFYNRVGSFIVTESYFRIVLYRFQTFPKYSFSGLVPFSLFFYPFLISLLCHFIINCFLFLSF